MKQEKLYKLKDRLIDELEKCYKDGPIDTATMESIYKLCESIKDLDKILMTDNYEEGYSQRGMNRNSYGENGNNSYGRNTQRQGMSYDSAKFNMVHKLNDLMMCTDNDHTKSVLQNAIGQLETNN